MSSEPRPDPITNVFNVKDWIPTTSSGNSDFATNATNAVTSSNVVVTAPSLNQDHFPTFVSASTGASLPEIADPDLKYNPSTNTLTATNVTVTGTLTATDTLSVGTLTAASNCTIGNSLSTFTVNAETTNIGNYGLGATDKVNIAGGINTAESELTMGSTTLTRTFLRAVI